MPTNKRPSTPDMSDERRHQKGLEALRAALQEKDPYDAVLQLDANPAVDPALREAALRVANVKYSTTVTLEMSEAKASSVLLALCSNFGKLWGDLGTDGTPDENDLSYAADYAEAIVSMADALQTPAAQMARQQRTVVMAFPPRTIKSEIVHRLEDLRAEFADDPRTIEFLIDMAGLFEDRPRQEPPAAT